MRRVIDNISGNEIGIGVAGCDDDVILITIGMVVGLTLMKKVIIMFMAIMLLIMTMYHVTEGFCKKLMIIASTNNNYCTNEVIIT